MNNDLRPINTIPNFKRFCMTIGELPASYLETMSYYEMLVWFTEYMKNTIIPTINNNGLAVEELQDKYIELKSYVDNYFTNLDVQQEINNKLDEMVANGVLEQIIEQFIQSTALWCFDTVADMKNATNLINGSYVRTLGYYSVNDGGGATYKITNTKSETDYQEVVGTLYATLIFESYINPLSLGAKGDETNDDYSIISSAINYCYTKNKPLMLSKIHAIGTPITLIHSINIYGTEYSKAGFKYIGEANSFITFNSGSDFSSIKNITINGSNIATVNVDIQVPYIDITNCLIKNNTLSCIKIKKSYCDNFKNNRFYGGDYALLTDLSTLTNSASCNAISFEDNVVLNCEKFAIVAGGGDQWLVNRNTIEQAKLGVAYVSYITNFTFSNNYLEHCAEYPNLYTMGNKQFYVRAIVTFNNSSTFDTFIGSAISYNAKIENNFVNIDSLQGTIPEGYDDNSCLCLCEGVDHLSIENNRCTTNSRYDVMYGSRNANTHFYNCMIQNNSGFLGSKMLGTIFDESTVCPKISDIKIPNYNYIKELDFSNCENANETLVATSNTFYNSTVYNIKITNNYARLIIPESYYTPLKGKTINIGFYGKIPSESKIAFYIPQLYQSNFTLTRKLYDNNKWDFVGTTINVPSDASGDMSFYFKVDTIPADKTVDIARLILTEVGTDFNDVMIK